MEQLTALFIPEVSQIFLKSSYKNSPLWSVLKHLIFFSFSFSASILNVLKASKTFDLCLSIVAQESWEKSSIIRKNKLLPPKVEGVIGPHMSLKINSNGCRVNSNMLKKKKKNFLYVFPMMQL